MINESTYEKMRAMKISHMGKLLRQMCEGDVYGDCTFEEKMGLLVDYEWDFRRTSRIVKLNRQARLAQPEACVENIEYLPERQMDKDKILRLASCSYIKGRENIICLGKTGAGKSFVANALGNAACRAFYRVRYVRLQELFDEFAVARNTGDFRKTFNAFAKPDLLILDDFFLTQPTRTNINDLLELIEARIYGGSTIYCSQLPPEDWHKRIDEKIIADSILDRIVHSSHVIDIKGESMRKRHSIVS